MAGRWVGVGRHSLIVLLRILSTITRVCLGGCFLTSEHMLNSVMCVFAVPALPMLLYPSRVR